MNRLAILVIVLAALSVSCSLGTEAIDVVVTDSPIDVGPQTPSFFQCDPPLQRTLNSGSLHIELDRQWHPEPPWDHIVVDGVGPVTVTATLIASSGASYTSSIAGSAGGHLNLRFDPEVPTDIEFETIRFESSASLRLETVVWHVYDPK